MSKTHEPVAGCQICQHFGRLGSKDLICSDEHWLASGVMDVPGWVLVATRRHAEGCWSLDDKEAASLGTMLRDLSSAVKAVTGAERVHLAAAGESAVHFHYLIMPRRPGEVPVLDSMEVARRGQQMADAARAIEVGDQLRARVAPMVASNG